jgi:cell division protein FtsZ
MIAYSHEPQTTIPTSSVKIVGLGGAGVNMLERIALEGLDGAELLALNTDVRKLSHCVANEKIQLGRNLTKGLGSGGDPDLGQQAVREAEGEIRAALKGRRIVFVCAGLGGGTGSGAAPIVTRIAREEGAFVVVFATMPFGFEGRRRQEQAQTSLNELAVLSNALVTFDNNRMGELVVAKQGIHEAFAAADRMISESIKAVIRLVVRPGLINIGLDDLMSALRTTRSRCLFGSGIADGPDRASKALRNALASPLLDQGALLKDAQTVLVHLSGGESLTLFEIELLMQGLRKFVPEKAHVLFGAAVDPTMGDSLSVTLISALPEDRLATVTQTDLLAQPIAEQPFMEPTDGFAAIEEEPEPVVEEIAPEPVAESSPANFAAEEEPEPAMATFVWVPKSDPVLVETPSLSELEPAAFTPEPLDLDHAEPEWLQEGEDALKEAAPEVVAVAEEPEPAGVSASEGPTLKLRAKTGTPSSELSLDGGPRGRFEGESPNVFEGEDLDLPPFLRKKR